MSDHGDSAAIRSYADKLRSAGRRLQAISDDADAWVYFCTADWKGQFKDDLLRLWNENFTANDTLNAQAWADQRESFIKAHPNRARLYDANFDPGKTAFRTLIDACNSFAAWLDDYATAIDKADQADETKFWVDVGIGVVVLVATVATAGLAAPETLAGGIALGAAIGGVTSVVMDASNQTIDNMILKGDSFGQALGDLNVQELTAAFGVGAIVGGFTVILGTGLNSVLTSGVSKIFGQAAINTFSRIGIAGLSFGTASALTDVAIQEVLTGKVDWGQVALAGGMGMVGGAAGAATMEVTGPEGTFTASVRPDGLLTVRNGDNDYVGTGSISPDGTQIVVQPPKGDPFTISLNGKVQVSDALSGFKIEDGQLTQLWSAGDGRTQLTVLTGRDSVPTELIDPATGKLVVREGWTISQTLPDGAVTISSPDGAVQVRGLVVAEQVGSGAPTGPQAMTLLPDGEVVPAGPSTASGPGVQGVRVGSWVSFGTTDATSGGTDPVAELLARFPGSGGSDGPSAPGIDAAPPAGPGDGGAGPGSALDLPGPKGWEPPGWNVQPDPGGSVVIGGKTYTDFPSAPAAQGGAGPEAGGSSATTLSGRPSGLRLSPQEGSGPATQTAVSQGVDVALADPPGSTASSAGVESVERLPIDPVADLPGSPSSAAPGPTAPSGGWSAAPAVVAGLAPGWAASWGMPAPAGLGPAPAPSPPRVPEVPGPLTSLPKPPPELTVSPQPEVPGPVGPRPTPPVTSVPGPTSIEVPPPGAPTPSAPLAPARPPLPGPSPTPDPTQVPPASRPGTLPPGQRPRVDPDVPTLPRPPRPGVEVPRPGTTDGPQPVPEVPSPAADEVPPLPRQEAVPPAMTEVLPPVGREVTSPQSWLPRPPIEVPPLNAGGPRPAGAPRPPAASTGPSLEGPEDDGGGKAEGEPDRGRATGSNLGFVPDGDEVSQPRSASNRGAENPEPEPAAAAAPAPPQGTSAWSPGPAETTLAGREVARVEPLPDWPEERGVFLVTFADGSRAVWKVRPGPQMVHNLAFFRTSEMLGFDLVPVTALRSLPEQGEGSLQEWVEGSPIQWPITGYSELDQQMGAVLDYIAAQTDRHNLNARVRPDGRLAFTDNKASFSKWRGLATSSDFVKAWRNRPLHPEVVEKVRGVSPEDYRAMLLGTGLEAVEADNAVARLQEIQARGMITGEADAGALPVVGGSEPASPGPAAQGGPTTAPGDGALDGPVTGESAPASGQGSPRIRGLAGWWRHLRERISGGDHGSEAEEAFRHRQWEERERFIGRAWPELRDATPGQRGEVLRRLSEEWRQLLEGQKREWEERFYGTADESRELAAALRQMEDEGAPAARNLDRWELAEGLFSVHRAFDVYRYPAGVTRPATTTITVWIRLQPDPDVTAADVEFIQELARWSVDHYLSAPRHRLRDGSVLHVDVEFCGQEIPGAIAVGLHSGQGLLLTDRWWVGAPWVNGERFGAPFFPFAHEVGHYLGLDDEYVDPRLPGRRVFRDRSLMGEGPWEGLKGRHLHTIVETAVGARPLPDWELTESLVAERYDPRSNRRQTLLTAETRLRELMAVPLPDGPLAIQDLRASIERYAADVRAWIERNRPDPDDELAIRARARMEQAGRVLAHLDVKQAVGQWGWWTTPQADGQVPVEQMGAQLNEAVETLQRTDDPSALRELKAAVVRADLSVAALRTIQSSAAAAVEKLEAFVPLADLDPALKARVDEVLTSSAADDLAQQVSRARDRLTAATTRLLRAGRLTDYSELEQAVGQWERWTTPQADGQIPVERAGAKLDAAVTRFQQVLQVVREAVAARTPFEDPTPFARRELDAAITEADRTVTAMGTIRSRAEAAARALEALAWLEDLDPDLKVRLDALRTSSWADELARRIDQAEVLLRTAAADLQPQGTAAARSERTAGLLSRARRSPEALQSPSAGQGTAPLPPSGFESEPLVEPPGGDQPGGVRERWSGLVSAGAAPGPVSAPSGPSGALRIAPLAQAGAGELGEAAAGPPSESQPALPPRTEPELRTRQHAQRAELLARQQRELRAAAAGRRPELRREHAERWRQLRAAQDEEWERWWADQAGRPLDWAEEHRAQLRRMEVEGAPEAGRVIESRAIPEVDEAGKDLGRVAYYHTNHFEVVLHPAGVTQPAVTEIIVHVYLGPEVDVTPEEIEQVKQYASQSVEHFFTAPRHRLPDGSVLKVDLRFGTGPSGISTPVRLRTGPGRMSAGEWYVNARFSAFAHEVGHLIGLLDEYFDPERRTPGRETEQSPGVFDDKSLMAGDTLETELKPRHLEQIWALIQTTRRAIPPESLEEGLTRYRFDPLSNRRQTLLTADSRLERLLMEPHPSDVREMAKLIGSLEQAVADVQGWLDRNRPEPSDELAARARGHLDRAHRLLLDLERARRRSGLPPRGGVEADRPAIPPNLGSGVPAEAIEFIATHTSAFLAAGGAVEVIEPGTSREPWARQAEELAANAEGGDRVAAGRRLLARALRQPYVVVARRGDALMAAIGFDVDPAGSLDVRSAGSAEAGTGAGTAAHFELARYAARRGLRVEDGYTRDARAYHAALGRRLDEEFQGDSVWSVSDVEQIAREVTARVGPAEASQPGPPSHPAAGLMEGMDAARRAVDGLQRAVTWGLEPGEVERRRAAAEAALEALARAEAAPGPWPAALEEFLRASRELVAAILGAPELTAWPLSEAELDLARRAVAGFGSLRSEARSARLVRFADGSRGVWKPEIGVSRLGAQEWRGAELWRRVGAESWERVPEDEWKWVRELAAYRLDRLLGFELVPTTVARAFEPEGVGALQAWVEGGPGLRYPEHDRYPELDRQRLAVLDYAIANPDRTAENLVTRPDGRPAAIDHGDAFPARAEGQRLASDFVAELLLWRRALAPEVWEAVRALDLGEVYRMLRVTGLGHEAAEGVLARLREIRERGRIVGEAWPGAILDSQGLVRRPRS